jgi:hypothetical protein
MDMNRISKIALELYQKNKQPEERPRSRWLILLRAKEKYGQAQNTKIVERSTWKQHQKKNKKSNEKQNPYHEEECPRETSLNLPETKKTLNEFQLTSSNILFNNYHIT